MLGIYKSWKKKNEQGKHFMSSGRVSCAYFQYDLKSFHTRSLHTFHSRFELTSVQNQHSQNKTEKLNQSSTLYGTFCASKQRSFLCIVKMYISYVCTVRALE